MPGIDMETVPSSTQPRVVVFNDDLIFFSRIDGRAAHAGCKALQARGVDRAVTLSTDASTRLVLVDIHLAGPDLPRLVSAVHSIPNRPKIVGFGSHVEAQALRAAREAGCDLVLPRSKFVEDLLTCWDDWVRPPGPPTP